MAGNNIPFGPERRPWHESLSEVAVTMDGELLVTPPTSEPLQLGSYPEVAGITSSWYQVPSTGLSHDQRKQAFDEMAQNLSYPHKYFLGSHAILYFNGDAVKRFLDCFSLTGGDPFRNGPCDLNMKWIERSVLDYFASLWHAKWPHNPQDPESYWGHITNLDTTEASAYALRSARDYLLGKFVINTTKPLSSKTSVTDPRNINKYVNGEFETHNPVHANSPVVFFSSEAHHSARNAAHVVMIPTFHELGAQLYPDDNPLGGQWPTSVPCTGGGAGPGTIDIPSLAKLVDFFSKKGHPIVVIFNYGSSFKGACDDVKSAGEVLIPILKRNGLYERTLSFKSMDHTFCIVRKGFWFHVDGAVAGISMPFVAMAHRKGLIQEKPGPIFDFRLDFVSSLAANCHSWLGSPWPSAVFMMRTSHQLQASAGKEQVSHYGFIDSGLACARYALSTLTAWSHFSQTSYDLQVKKVVGCLATVIIAEQELLATEKNLGLNLWVLRSPHSLSVCFRKPSDDIVQKYHLKCEMFRVNGELRSYARLSNINEQGLTMLLRDLQGPQSFL